MRTIVLGLGNPVLSDDRIGLAVAGAVWDLLDKSPLDGVDVRESMRGGLDLIDLLTGYDRAIIIDCFVATQHKPGRIRRFTLDDVSGSALLSSAHEMDLAGVFRLAQRLGIPMPGQVEIIGIEGGEVEMLSEQMTPELQAAVEPLARQIHARLVTYQQV